MNKLTAVMSMSVIHLLLHYTTNFTFINEIKHISRGFVDKLILGNKRHNTVFKDEFQKKFPE